MIKCSRCGADNPADAANCQRCGMLLKPMPDNAGQEQLELPAWLETLRADRRPTPQASQEASRPAQMQKGDDMPAWMRTGLMGAQSMTPPGSFSSQRPSSMPAPNTDGAQLPLNGMAASSLIDEQSLPSWLHESKMAGQPAPRDNVSASSLVQHDSLPDWMRTMPPAPDQSAASSQARPPLSPPQGPISGSDLIDPQALPPWMTNQPAPSQPGQHFDAASLIDAGALPTWMREGQSQQAPAPSLYQAMPQQANWQAPVPPGAPYNEQMPQAQAMSDQGMNAQPPANSLSAASLIDMNALPDWLRPAGEQQGIPGSPAPYGSPGRVENMRVPSRPRSGMGMGQQEDSAVAANAFMSVLGVASAPTFPAPPPGQIPPSQPSASSAGSAPFASMPPQSPGPAMTGMPGNQPGGMYSGYQPGSSAAPAQMPAGYQNGMSSPGAMPFPADAAPAQAGQRSGSEPARPARPAKRGIFEALRDWLFR